MTTDESILGRLSALRAADLPVHGGRTMAYVYDSGRPELDELAAAAQAAYSGVNGLDMTVFPSVVALENDLVRRAAGLLGGDEQTVGTFTSGGTESCLLAVHAARTHARRTRGIDRPEMVLPSTVHPAFHKAAELFGIQSRVVPVDGDRYTVRAADVQAAMTADTALVVVSAPSYAHGVIDPVVEVSEIARARGVLCHVDACIGGWFLGHLRLAADAPEIPTFDLSAPGVTSISVDLHKYGYTPKGASIVLFRDDELRRDGYFVHTAWPGYPVITTTLQGTKSAAPLAGAWAVVERVGTDGYIELSRKVHHTTRLFIDGVDKIPGLRVLGSPQASLLAVTSDDPELDVFVLADEMRAAGWYLQPQLAYLTSPANLHLTVTAAMANPESATELLDQLSAAADRARAVGPAEVNPMLKQAAATLDPRTLGPDEATAALTMAGIGDGNALPERMAPVLAALQVLPEPIAARLLPEVISRLYRGTIPDR
ncbi:pyridoxal phosphate-dependent decarboxylase family protein [Phytoactinopolyspora halotolerans]|uniref:Aspartate aminotransferase family protein n=1 Tax=Phytoactinopolyspora halotolerans TaxID=1981512 RepID=A0A6L9S6L1_9ACTN|nr:aspartate aminotransferase family protein [Phytoactinopolyspora halotolerans]NEE01105.1 aspartate aminotransferase family protein [Phytoactinopolyspora halotolerans]